MNDVASRKIDGAELGEKAAAPDHVCEGIVDDDAPHRKEDGEGREAHPLDDGSRNKCRRDDREHHLIDGKAEVWNGREPGADVGSDPVHSEPVQIADDPSDVARKRQGVTKENPENGSHTHAKDTGEHRVDDILSFDEASVEEGEARCHEEHQGGRNQEPGNVGVHVTLLMVKIKEATG